MLPARPIQFCTSYDRTFDREEASLFPPPPDHADAAVGRQRNASTSSPPGCHSAESPLRFHPASHVWRSSLHEGTGLVKSNVGSAFEKCTTVLERIEDELTANGRAIRPQRSCRMRPKVYQRLTDNWLGLTLRFIAKGTDSRAQGCHERRHSPSDGRFVASATFEIVGVPPIIF